MKKNFKKRLAVCLLSALTYIGCSNQAGDSNNISKPSKISNLEERLEPIYHHYGKNIFYKDLSKIDFNEWGEHPKKIPESFLKKLKKPEIKNQEEFQQLVLSEALKLGYTKKKISKLEPYEAIRLAADIVANKITYENVDGKDSEFFKEYGVLGFKLQHDEIFRIGKGDCDKYAMLTVGVLNFFKEFNQYFTNIYFSDNIEMNENIFSLMHEWVSIICIYEDKIIFSQIDPTFYDNGAELEAGVGWHLPYNQNKMLAIFYEGICEFKGSLQAYQKALKEEEEPIKRAGIYEKLAFLSNMTNNGAKMEEIRENYFKENLDNKTEDRFTASILYYSYSTEKDMGNHEKAEEFKQRLFSEFPNSYWAKYVML